ncbi:Calcium-transporting ATPase 3 [Cytospora mali]|uniref:P-type Na(+) transporter n=1 Tax=Cytospora mali TaxID=578113 RepID=A0A194VX10_CYTMA|nr:Calcium-transporting ATPase 3 [Valsa mali]
MLGQFDRHPFLLPLADVAAVLNTDIDNGLTSTQVSQLQQQYPRNELEVEGAISWYTIFIKQLFNAMILVLMFATIVSLAIKDWIEGGVLAVVIILNVSIGFLQEYKAEKKMDALRALSSPSASVLRDGKIQVIPNPEVVPGDIVVLKMGDTIPADLRMFEAMNLSCDEQGLTGEAAPVEKTTANDILAPDTEKLATSESEVGIGDRTNVAYATTIVRKGRGRGIVIATGMLTEVGKIAASTTKKTRRPGRSMDWRKHGKTAPIKGGSKRLYDFFGKFLGLTEGTPLQIRLSKLAYVLFLAALILAVIVFAVNRFKIPNEIIVYAISTGISIIPESLVAVLTITMVVATTVMRKANVVVRDLSALEALGGVTNICSDKTGTLTQGAMIVRKAWLPLSNIYTVHDSEDPNNPTVGRVTHREVSFDAPEPNQERDFDQERSAPALRFDVPYGKPEQKQKSDPEEEEAKASPGLYAFLLAASLCNLATVRYDQQASKWQTTGEPTEIALQVFSHRFDVRKRELEANGWQQISEFPFDSVIKRMSVIYDAPQANPYGVQSTKSMVYTKGAVERVLDLCSTIGTGEDQQPLTDEMKDKVLTQMDNLASQGLRVLAVASKEWEGRFSSVSSPPDSSKDDALRSQVENNLTLLGLAGIYDPPRRETTPAIAECASAGIKVHMLTGDHPSTARAIAKEVGIIPRNPSVLPATMADSIVLKATDFDKLTDAEIDALDELPLVIARCAPDTKTRMIEALRRRKAFMAMTGDGVNDAPSLSNADVGIAMGSGSDVAKSAAKIVLADDKFNSIVAAIREGRRMFDNVQKFILHLLTSNVGEVILLIIGLAFQDKSGFSVFPISPLEIIWINMITSSFPAFGLGREKAATDVMNKPPHANGIFTKQVLIDMAVYGVLMGACTLATFVIIIYGANGGNLGVDCNRSYSDSCIPVFRARAAVFAELTWLILLSAWEFKHLRRSMFALTPGQAGPLQFCKDIYENLFLFWAVFIGILSVFLTVNIPVVNTKFFKHAVITWEWGLVVGFTVLFVAGMETWKAIKRAYHLLDDQAVEQGAFSQGSVEGRRLSQVLSFSSLKGWASFGKRNTGETWLHGGSGPIVNGASNV